MAEASVAAGLLIHPDLIGAVAAVLDPRAIEQHERREVVRALFDAWSKAELHSLSTPEDAYAAVYRRLRHGRVLLFGIGRVGDEQAPTAHVLGAAALLAARHRSRLQAAALSRAAAYVAAGAEVRDALRWSAVAQ